MFKAEFSKAKMIQFASQYIACVRLSFLKLIAYRLRYFTGIITYLMFVSVHYYIWKAIYDQNPNGVVINGFTFDEIITYVTIGWIARSLYFSDIDDDISELVKTGQISIYLIRPIRFHLVMLSEALGGLIFRFFLFTLPISIVLLSIFPVQLPVSLSALVGFLFGTFASFLVLAEVNFILGLVCFYLKSIDGFMRAKYFFIQLFSGLLLPISFFPEWLRSVMNILPFKLIAATPLEIYLGKLTGVSLVLAILHTVAWALSLFLISEIFSKFAFRKLSIQGG